MGWGAKAMEWAEIAILDADYRGDANLGASGAGEIRVHNVGPAELKRDSVASQIATTLLVPFLVTRTRGSELENTIVKKALAASQLEHLEEHIPYELLMLRFTLGKLRTEKHPLAWNGMLRIIRRPRKKSHWFLINKRNHAEDHIAREFAETRVRAQCK